MQELRDTANFLENKLRELVSSERERLKNILDGYIVELKRDLKAKSDGVFKQILEEYTAKIEEFRAQLDNYSQNAGENLAKIQRALEEAVLKIKSHEPQLTDFLTKTEENKVIREKILKLVETEDEINKETRKNKNVKTEAANQASEDDENIVHIKGIKKQIIVPWNHITLPQEVSTDIIPAFDKRIPFTDRVDIIEEKMKKNMKAGQLYHENTMDIVRAIMCGDWPYLWGPTGCGKSMMISQISELLGLGMLKAGKITEPFSILGYNDPQGNYRLTPTFIAYLYGYLLFFDEFDNGNADTAVIMNDIFTQLDNRIHGRTVSSVIFGDDIPVFTNPNFRLVAAGNTKGKGGDEQNNPDRGPIGESIRQRMSPFQVGYDDRLEKAILKGYDAWYKFFVLFRKACMEYKTAGSFYDSSESFPEGIVTTRDATFIKDYLDNNAKSIDSIILEKFVQIKDQDYLSHIGNYFANEYRIKYEPYNNLQQTRGEFGKPLIQPSDKEIVTEEFLAKKLIHYCYRGGK